MSSFDTRRNASDDAHEVASEHPAAAHPSARRRPGRPLEMTGEQVVGRIRELSAAPDGLFRVHLAAPALYARARRLFGSWGAAVRLAGVDYETLQGVARARSLQTRRRDRRRPRGANERHANGEAL